MTWLQLEVQELLCQLGSDHHGASLAVSHFTVLGTCVQRTSFKNLADRLNSYYGTEVQYFVKY
jgi:hypothetical protein